MDEPTHARRRLAPHPIADSVHEVPTGVEVPIKTFFIEVQLKQTEAVQVIKAMKTVMAAKPFATKPKQRLRPGVGGPGSQEERVWPRPCSHKFKNPRHAESDRKSTKQRLRPGVGGPGSQEEEKKWPKRWRTPSGGLTSPG